MIISVIIIIIIIWIMRIVSFCLFFICVRLNIVWRRQPRVSWVRAPRLLTCTHLIVPTWFTCVCVSRLSSHMMGVSNAVRSHTRARTHAHAHMLASIDDNSLHVCAWNSFRWEVVLVRCAPGDARSLSAGRFIWSSSTRCGILLVFARLKRCQTWRWTNSKPLHEVVYVDVFGGRISAACFHDR